MARGWIRKQTDGYNCGPIACVKLMELFDCPEYRIMDDDLPVDFFQGVIITKFQALLTKYDNVINVTVPCELCDLTSDGDTDDESSVNGSVSGSTRQCFCYCRTRKNVIMNMSCCGKEVHQACLQQWLMSQGTCVYCRAVVEVKDVTKCNSQGVQMLPKDMEICHELDAHEESMTPVRPTHEVAREAQVKKSLRQQRQSEQMKKLHKKNVKKLGGKIGAVVTIKNDVRDISHPHGTMGVMYDAKDTGGIKVCSEWGTIAQGPSKKHYWIPMDRYRVVFGKDEEAVISDKLEKIRNDIIAGTFDAGKHRSLTLQDTHRELVGETPKGKRKYRHKGACTIKCGCWGNKRPCNSSCRCGGRCQNPYNN
mmetsp:Transcript_22079/g.37865  ORF Transcript_22079/g.37865 Transcript_22079/m.37865 type:complete len:365 (+) Transcript_22079:2548-3642(+)